MISQLSGLGGAFCTMCTASHADGHDLLLIETRGFPIDRTMDDIHALFVMLAELDAQGNEAVIKSDGDYEWRTGLTTRPLTKLDMTIVLPPLHAKLRIFGMFCQVAYRYRSGVKKMGRGQANKLNPEEKAALKTGKEDVRPNAMLKNQEDHIDI